MKTDTASGIYGVYIGNKKCSHNALVTKKTDIFKMTKSQNLTDSQVKCHLVDSQRQNIN